MKIKMVLFTASVFFTLHALSAQTYGISSEFHEDRRQALREKMPPNSVAVLFSSPVRNRANDVDYVYHPDPNFYYLTGWAEPHAVLLIYSNQQADAQGVYDEVLFVRERDPQAEMWNGKRKGTAGALNMGFDRVKDRVDFQPVENTYDRFDAVLLFDFENDVRDFKNDANDLFDLQKRFKKSIRFPANFDRNRYQIHQAIRTVSEADIPRLKRQLNFAINRDSELQKDPVIMEFLQTDKAAVLSELKIKSAFEFRNFNFDVEQLSGFMAELREIKTAEELDLLKKAIVISAQGQIEVMKAVHPEMTEREVQGIHQFVFKKYGAAHEGYPSIVGAGHNACVLHYIANDKTDIENQLILMDVGAEYQGYTADVTRTIPVSGRFTESQRELYEIVYEAQLAGIAQAQVGGSFRAISMASYAVVQKGLLALGIIDRPEDYRRYLPHGVSHHIGLDVHDAGTYGELKANMVITVEPGIYIPKDSPCDKKWWDIGIRIEDDILITESGPINLSDKAPRKWEAIESMMRQPSPLDDFVLPKIED